MFLQITQLCCIPSNKMIKNKKNTGIGEVTEWMAAFVAKPDKQSWIPHIYMIEGKKQLHKAISAHHVLLCMSAHIHECIYAYM